MAENIIKANVSMGILNPLATFFLNAATLIILYLSAQRMVSGASAVTGGDVLAMIQYVAYIMSGVLNAAFAIVMVPHAAVACRRILQVMDLPDDGRENGAEGELCGDIALEHVTFSFEEGAEPAVRDVTMEIFAGKRVAIIGSTGSGKSALVQLLLGFQQPQSGKIRLDGRDSTELSGSCIRRQISCVLQKTAIYAGTIRENIAMSKPDATDEEIVAAAKASHAHHFIKLLPHGYDTVITEDGGVLSQGQKQLLCIARVMLNLPPMLILDEATSSIDTRTEMKIQEAFAAMMKGRTSFIVAHRLSTIREADVIIVMKDGRIIEQGNHESLLQKNGFYASLYNSQFSV